MMGLGLAFWAMNSAFASVHIYALKMDLALHGKHVSSPSVTVQEGKSATITAQHGSELQFVEVTVLEKKDPQGILMKFVVGTIGKNGAKTITAKPQLIARENELAKMTQSDSKTNSELLSLSVIARKTAR